MGLWTRYEKIDAWLRDEVRWSGWIAFGVLIWMIGAGFHWWTGHISEEALAFVVLLFFADAWAGAKRFRAIERRLAELEARAGTRVDGNVPRV